MTVTIIDSCPSCSSAIPASQFSKLAPTNLGSVAVQFQQVKKTPVLFGDHITVSTDGCKTEVPYRFSSSRVFNGHEATEPWQILIAPVNQSSRD